MEGHRLAAGVFAFFAFGWALVYSAESRHSALGPEVVYSTVVEVKEVEVVKEVYVYPFENAGGRSGSTPPSCDSENHSGFIYTAGLADAAGFDWHELHTAVAVAYAESGGDPFAINHNNDGSTDYGLWQINSVHGFDDLFNPVVNAEAAFDVWQRQGWTAWYAHTPFNRSYGSGQGFRRFLDESFCSIDFYFFHMVQ